MPYWWGKGWLKVVCPFRIQIILHRMLAIFIYYVMITVSVISHYIDVIMTTMASQITSLTIVYSTVYSDADQRKHESSASLAFVWGIHRRPVNSPHKRPVTRKMFPFDDVIMHLLLGMFLTTLRRTSSIWGLHIILRIISCGPFY